MLPCTFVICSHLKESHEKEVDFLYHQLVEASFRLDEENPSLIIVLGGDGSFLHALHEYDFKGKYLLVNTGHLGFFSDYDIKELKQCAQDIITNEEVEEKLPLFKASYLNRSHVFLSDLVLEAEKTSEFSLNVDDKYLTKARATGLVVASSVGSTGYIGSLDSPVSLSSEPIYQYSFIAPVYNRLYPNTIDKAILSQKQKLFISINDGRVRATIDGLTSQEVEGEVEVEASDETVSLIHFKDSDNFIRIYKAITVPEER